MVLTILGFCANLTSLILWIPQAITTWRNRHNSEALKGISYATQTIVMINTVLWCIYGILIHSMWLAMGTIIILPLALFTVIMKLKSNH